MCVCNIYIHTSVTAKVDRANLSRQDIDKEKHEKEIQMKKNKMKNKKKSWEKREDDNNKKSVENLEYTKILTALLIELTHTFWASERACERVREKEIANETKRNSPKVEILEL